MSLLESLGSYELSPRIIEQWNNFAALLNNANETTLETHSISPTEAYRFRADFFGLLKYKFNMEEEFFYPHLIVNKLNSPLDYTENMLVVKTIGYDVLNELLGLIALWKKK